jgi:molecular chaperone DnaJ
MSQKKATNWFEPKAAPTWQHYETLAVEKTSTLKEIKTSYNKLAPLYHSDRGGCDEKFIELTAARDVLVDPRKRALYDLVGDGKLEEAVLEQERRISDSDILNINQSLSLEEAYAGKTIVLNYNRTSFCIGCHGSGYKPSKLDRCTRCSGYGKISRIHMLGQQISRCHGCRGIGKRQIPVDDSAKCKDCDGDGKTSAPHSLDVVVNRNTPDDFTEMLHGEGHEVEPGFRAPVRLILKHVPRSNMGIEGDNIVMVAQISLADALMGCKIHLDHPSGKKYLLTSQPGYVISPDTVLRWQGMGMVTDHRIYSREQEPLEKPRVGDLLIHFAISWPTSSSISALSPSSMSQLRQLLGEAEKGVEEEKEATTELVEDAFSAAPDMTPAEAPDIIDIAMLEDGGIEDTEEEIIDDGDVRSSRNSCVHQ